MEVISDQHRSTARLLPSAPSHLHASDVVFAHNRFDPFSSDNRVLETVPSLRSVKGGAAMSDTRSATMTPSLQPYPIIDDVVAVGVFVTPPVMTT